MNKAQLATELQKNVVVESSCTMELIKSFATKNHFTPEQLDDILHLCKYVACEAILEYHNLVEKEDL